MIQTIHEDGIEYLLLENIECKDAEGKRFEYYEQLLVMTDVLRKREEEKTWDDEIDVTLTPLDLTYSGAISLLKSKKMFLPSFPLTCNIMASLHGQKDDPLVQKVLAQYGGFLAEDATREISFDPDYMKDDPDISDSGRYNNLVYRCNYMQNSILIPRYFIKNGKNQTLLEGVIIHNPQLQDIGIKQDKQKEKSERRVELGFDHNYGIELTFDRKAPTFLQNLTGLHDPAVLQDIMNTLGKRINISIPLFGDEVYYTTIGGEFSEDKSKISISRFKEGPELVRGCKIPEKTIF